MSEEHRQHHINLLPGEAAATVLIPDDSRHLDVFTAQLDEFKKVNQKREYITFTGKKGDVEISATSTGLGCSPTAIGVEELVRIGTKNIIRLGACRAIQEYLKPGDLIIPIAAVRSERATQELIPIDYPAIADFRVVRALIDACDTLKLPYHLGIVRTHDALYLEPSPATGVKQEEVQQWIDMDILAQDNETSAVFVVAGMQGVRSGAILLCEPPVEEMAGNDAHETGVQNVVAASIEAACTLHKKGLD